MEHNPISMGDVAYSMVSDVEAENRSLRTRVDELERFRLAVIEWSEEIAAEINELHRFTGNRNDV